MAYDDWKLATPPEGDDGGDFDVEEGSFRTHRDDEREGCVLGQACLHHDPFHTSAECFDVEMAEAYMAPEPVAGPNGCTCGFNGDCNCRFIP